VNSTVFGHLTPLISVDMYQHFRGICCFHDWWKSKSCRKRWYMLKGN